MTGKRNYDPKVCLVGSEKPYPALDSMLSILNEVLGSNNIVELRMRDWMSNSRSSFKLFLYVLQDLTAFLRIVSCRKKTGFNMVLLFQSYYPLTCLGMKLLEVKAILYLGGSNFYWSYNEERSSITRRFLVYANLPAENVCHKFADMIVTLSKNMIGTIRVGKYMHKTRFALPRLDRDFYIRFRTIESYEDRKCVIGFLGRVCRRKGVLGFVKAIPLIALALKQSEFLIVGEGPLLATVIDEVNKLELTNPVNVTSYVEYADLVDYYNRMKLYILPSYCEGIPSTIFEAIACGTPVLATSVGGISEIIKDGETGFLLKSISAEYIAQRVVELLKNPELLSEVSAKANLFVRENFNHKKTLGDWQKIFRDLE